MRTFIILMLTVVLLLLAACGGEGSDGALDQTPSTAALGSRAVPGYLLQVDCDGDLLPATQRSITLDLKPENGQAAPTLVEAALGSNPPGTWLDGSPSDNHLRWTWTLTLPEDLSDQRVWLRVTDAEGNVAESGFDDFALTP